MIHVLDASRAVGVAGSLVSDSLKEPLVASLATEYAEIRASRADRGGERLISLADARANRLHVALDHPAPVPTFLGVRTFERYPLEELVDRIDWTPFFQTWELAGHYPAILEDPTVGKAARELFRDARAMLDRIVTDNLLEARATLGFFQAAAVGDDITVATPNGPATIHTLRQQHQKTGPKPNLALADLVAPAESGQPDYLGLFAVTAGIGLDRLTAAFEQQHDDYQSILAKALADRLAEAFAERLHERVRREFWGYAPGESLDNTELIREKYQGIRPAPGYPACPDHTEKATLFQLLGGEAQTGIRLTESFAMLPTAAVSGLYFWRPESQYFGVGKLGRDQVADYARRKNLTLLETERWLGPSLGYRVI